LAIAVFKDEKAGNGLLKTLDAAVGGMIADVIESEEFTASKVRLPTFTFQANH